MELKKHKKYEILIKLGKQTQNPETVIDKIRGKVMKTA